MKKVLRSLTTAVMFVTITTPVFAQAPTTNPIRLYRDTAPGSVDFVIDFAGDPIIEQLYREGRLFEDNVLTKYDVRMTYSSKTNRVHSQSFSCIGLNDPCDISVTRTPEIDPNTRLPATSLPHWGLIGIVGGRNWNGGARHYGAGIEYIALSLADGTVGMCLSTAPGIESQTRYSGRNRNGEHLVCQVLIMPNGDMVFGYNTDPNYVPKIIFQGQPYFNTEASPKWFSGDALSLLSATPAEENAHRAGMREVMLKKSD